MPAPQYPPIAPVLRMLGIQEADAVAPATVVGIAEVYLPALVVKEKVKSESSRFFVAVLSITQLIFFSSVAPMLLELFREIPARSIHLVFLFVLRTLILVPSLALFIKLLVVLGFLRL